MSIVQQRQDDITQQPITADTDLFQVSIKYPDGKVQTLDVSARTLTNQFGVKPDMGQWRKAGARARTRTASAGTRNRSARSSGRRRSAASGQL